MKGLFLAMVGGKAFAPNSAIITRAPRSAGTLSREERDHAILDSMPPAARDAFALGMGRMAVRALPVTDQPPAPPASRQGHDMHASNLTAADVAAARTTFARMAEPLTAAERALCANSGWDETVFKEERDRKIAEDLPNYYAGQELGLTKAEATIADQLGQSYQAYAAEKGLQGHAKVAPSVAYGADVGSLDLTAVEMKIADDLGLSHAAYAAEKLKAAG